VIRWKPAIQAPLSALPPEKGKKVIAKVASSFISHEQAWQNLKEWAEKDFETVKQEGRDAWNEVLG
jgi:putative alpha-1,2-mannosidase